MEVLTKTCVVDTGVFSAAEEWQTGVNGKSERKGALFHWFLTAMYWRKETNSVPFFICSERELTYNYSLWSEGLCCKGKQMKVKWERWSSASKRRGSSKDVVLQYKLDFKGCINMLNCNCQ